jgi:hypothetical protein
MEDDDPGKAAAVVDMLQDMAPRLPTEVIDEQLTSLARTFLCHCHEHQVDLATCELKERLQVVVRHYQAHQKLAIQKSSFKTYLENLMAMLTP